MSFSSASRHSARRHRDRGPAPPRVFALTAPPSAVETGRLPTLPLPARRFSQPLSGSDDGTDLRVYSTPQALQGFRPSEPDSEAIGGRLRPRAPSPLPALHVFLPRHERHLLLSPPRRYYPNRDSPRGKAPRLLAETGFRLGFRPTLKLCARSGAPRSLAGFTRPEASATLLAFPSSRVFLPGRPGPYGPPLMRFESRCKVLLRPEMTSPCGDISPPGVFAFCSELSLWNREMPRLSFPFGPGSAVTSRP
jgi:hypothetical protein